MGFSNAVITNEGAALIAASTATNQIIIDAAYGSTAYLTAQQLKDLTVSTAPAYPVGGGILSAAAVSNVARVVAGFPSQSTAKALKTIWITAHTTNDPLTRTLCAVSDNTYTFYIPATPSAGRIPMTATISLSIQITDSASVSASAATSGYVTYGELPRFVSVHKAGDPTSGDAQDIYGAKTFNDNVYINSRVEVNHGDGITLYDQDGNPGGAIYAHNSTFKIISHQAFYDYNTPALSLCVFDEAELITLSQDEEDRNLVTIGAMNSPCVRFYSNSIENSAVLYCSMLPAVGSTVNLGSASQYYNEIHSAGVSCIVCSVSDITTTGSYIGLHATIKPSSTGVYDIGSDSATLGRIYSNEYYTSSNRSFPVCPAAGYSGQKLLTNVGSILMFYVRHDYLGSGRVGTTFTASGSAHIPVARSMRNSSGQEWGESNYYVDEGTWQLLCDNVYPEGTTTQYAVLAIRIS